jgi:hypothetical protein
MAESNVVNADRGPDDGDIGDSFWVKDWLLSEGYISEGSMIEDGWTLDTMEEIPIAEAARELADHLNKPVSLHESMWECVGLGERYACWREE